MPLPYLNRFGMTLICGDFNEFPSEIPGWSVLHCLVQHVGRVRHSLKIVEVSNEMGFRWISMSAILFSGLSFLTVEPAEAMPFWLWASTKKINKKQTRNPSQTFPGMPSKSLGVERLLSVKDVSRLSARP